MSGQFHFDPERYLDMMREEVPLFDRLHDEVATAGGAGARRILDLGVGTGETARRVLAAHPSARLVGIDASDAAYAFSIAFKSLRHKAHGVPTTGHTPMSSSCSASR